MSSSSSDSEPPISESNETPADTMTTSNKIFRTPQSMILIASDEELQYQAKHSKGVDVLQKYGDKLKCTKCCCSMKNFVKEGRDVFSHPLLKVLYCQTCINYYGNGDFSLDEEDENDMSDKYCRWCGEGGTLFLCSKCICGFCPNCIKKQLGKKALKEVEMDDDWQCYFCKSEPLWELRSICAMAISKSKQVKNTTNMNREDRLRKLMSKGSLGESSKTKKSSRNMSNSPSSGSDWDEKKHVSDKDANSSPEEKKKGRNQLFKKKKRKRPLPLRIGGRNRKGDSSSDSEDAKPEPKRPKKQRSPDEDSDAEKRTESPAPATKKRRKPKTSSDELEQPRKHPKKTETEVNGDAEQDPFEKTRTVTVQKLRKVLDVLQFSAGLCVDVCKKKDKKLSKESRFARPQKLAKECAKIKGIIQCLSVSLSTAACSVESLQKKLLENKQVKSGGKEDEDIAAAKKAVLKLKIKISKSSDQDEAVVTTVNGPFEESAGDVCDNSELDLSNTVNAIVEGLAGHIDEVDENAKGNGDATPLDEDSDDLADNDSNKSDSGKGRKYKIEQISLRERVTLKKYKEDDSDSDGTTKQKHRSTKKDGSKRRRRNIKHKSTDDEASGGKVRRKSGRRKHRKSKRAAANRSDTDSEEVLKLTTRSKSNRTSDRGKDKSTVSSSDGDDKAEEVETNMKTNKRKSSEKVSDDDSEEDSDGNKHNSLEKEKRKVVPESDNCDSENDAKEKSEKSDITEEKSFVPSMKVKRSDDNEKDRVENQRVSNDDTIDEESHGDVDDTNKGDCPEKSDTDINVKKKKKRDKDQKKRNSGSIFNGDGGDDNEEEEKEEEEEEEDNEEAKDCENKDSRIGKMKIVKKPKQKTQAVSSSSEETDGEASTNTKKSSKQKPHGETKNQSSSKKHDSERSESKRNRKMASESDDNSEEPDNLLKPTSNAASDSDSREVADEFNDTHFSQHEDDSEEETEAGDVTRDGADNSGVLLERSNLEQSNVVPPLCSEMEEDRSAEAPLNGNVTSQNADTDTNQNELSTGSPHGCDSAREDVESPWNPSFSRNLMINPFGDVTGAMGSNDKDFNDVCIKTEPDMEHNGYAPCETALDVRVKREPKGDVHDNVCDEDIPERNAKDCKLGEEDNINGGETDKPRKIKKNKVEEDEEDKEDKPRISKNDRKHTEVKEEDIKEGSGTDKARKSKKGKKHTEGEVGEDDSEEGSGTDKARKSKKGKKHTEGEVGEDDSEEGSGTDKARKSKKGKKHTEGEIEEDDSEEGSGTDKARKSKKGRKHTEGEIEEEEDNEEGSGTDKPRKSKKGKKQTEGEIEEEHNEEGSGTHKSEAEIAEGARDEEGGEAVGSEDSRSSTTHKTKEKKRKGKKKALADEGDDGKEAKKKHSDDNEYSGDTELDSPDVKTSKTKKKRLKKTKPQHISSSDDDDDDVPLRKFVKTKKRSKNKSNGFHARLEKLESMRKGLTEGIRNSDDDNDDNDEDANAEGIRPFFDAFLSSSDVDSKSDEKISDAAGVDDGAGDDADSDAKSEDKRSSDSSVVTKTQSSKCKNAVDDASSDSDDALATLAAKRNKAKVDKEENDEEEEEERNSIEDVVIEDGSDDEVGRVKKADAKKWKRLKTDEGESSESDDEGNKGTSKGRKNINKILKKESLQVETKEAVKMETERKKRLAAREEKYRQYFPNGEANGELVLDFEADTGEPVITVHRKLVKYLKPHQREGVKFMWDTCFESVERMDKDNGSGCILAHCMGLGKTLQVVTLVHTIFNHEIGLNTVLVVTPLNTVKNWVNEFEVWLTKLNSDPITLYDMSVYKNDHLRRYQLKDWLKHGGVMVISYETFRTLINRKSKKAKKLSVFENCLLDPGPDLVVCDEGHLLKNEDTALSKCMRRIVTSRRIVLTGTPLQNNLIEYHCMVQFVKPNILGNKKEFMNRFVNPIQNGQFEDSTDTDVKVMKRRSHVLHNMLEACVQRFDYSVLTPFLPKKYEYVMAICLSDLQSKLYKEYLSRYFDQSDLRMKGKLFSDYQALQRIWTHPRSLLAHVEKQHNQQSRVAYDSESEGSLKDFVVNSDSESEAKSTSDDSVEVMEEKDKTKSKRSLRSNAATTEEFVSLDDVSAMQNKEREKQWWDEYVNSDDMEEIKHSWKLVIMLSILRESQRVGDKVLLFSQSLYSLDLIEYFLRKVSGHSISDDSEEKEYWEYGNDYFRLDGSSSSEQRAQWVNYFNKSSNTRARLFLISTRAGGLGINLVSANRVIIFDASWNPSHDVQSIFRVYRFGQEKTCYIYRFLAEATMEEKIYERQVTKLSLACRVVDELQIERHYAMSTLKELYKYEPIPLENRKTPMVPKDKLFAGILREFKDVVVAYHEHDSLLENKAEEELTEEERKAAWDDYEKDKNPPPPKVWNQTDANLFLKQMQLQQQQQNYQFMLQQIDKQLQQQITGVTGPGAIMGQFVNPLAIQGAASGPLPTKLEQRGKLVGVTPFKGESYDNFFNRVRLKEYEVLQNRYKNMSNLPQGSALQQPKGNVPRPVGQQRTNLQIRPGFQTRPNLQQRPGFQARPNLQQKPGVKPGIVIPNIPGVRIRPISQMKQGQQKPTPGPPKEPEIVDVDLNSD